MSGSLELFLFFNRCRHERYAVNYGYRSLLIQFLILLVPERTGYKPEKNLVLISTGYLQGKKIYLLWSLVSIIE